MCRISRRLGAGLAAALTFAVPAGAQATPEADLAIVSKTANVKHAKVGDEVTFTIVATNNGPDTAELDVIETTLEGLELVSETCDLGISADTPACEYGLVEPGQTLTTTVVTRVTGTGGRYVVDTACVSSEEPIVDPNPDNDCATATVKIIGKR